MRQFALTSRPPSRNPIAQKVATFAGYGVERAGILLEHVHQTAKSKAQAAIGFVDAADGALDEDFFNLGEYFNKFSITPAEFIAEHHISAAMRFFLQPYEAQGVKVLSSLREGILSHEDDYSAEMRNVFTDLEELKFVAAEERPKFLVFPYFHHGHNMSVVVNAETGNIHFFDSFRGRADNAQEEALRHGVQLESFKQDSANLIPKLKEVYPERDFNVVDEKPVVVQYDGNMCGVHALLNGVTKAVRLAGGENEELGIIYQTMLGDQATTANVRSFFPRTEDEGAVTTVERDGVLKQRLVAAAAMQFLRQDRPELFPAPAATSQPLSTRFPLSPSVDPTGTVVPSLAAANSWFSPTPPIAAVEQGITLGVTHFSPPRLARAARPEPVATLAPTATASTTQSLATSQALPVASGTPAATYSPEVLPTTTRAAPARNHLHQTASPLVSTSATDVCARAEVDAPSRNQALAEAVHDTRSALLSSMAPAANRAEPLAVTRQEVPQNKYKPVTLEHPNNPQFNIALGQKAAAEIVKPNKEVNLEALNRRVALIFDKAASQAQFDLANKKDMLLCQLTFELAAEWGGMSRVKLSRDPDKKTQLTELLLQHGFVDATQGDIEQQVTDCKKRMNHLSVAVQRAAKEQDLLTVKENQVGARTKRLSPMLAEYLRDKDVDIPAPQRSEGRAAVLARHTSAASSAVVPRR